MWDFLGLQAFLIIAIVFVPLERIWQLHRGQKLMRGGMGLDLIHVFGTGLLVRIGLGLCVLTGAALATWVVPSVVQETVRSWPLWVQIPLAILVSDLCFYWMHRLHHRVPFLWRFHAIHHSIRELDWLAGHRVHPVDQTLTKGAGLVLLFALGFSEWAMWGYATIYLWQSMLLHSNVGIRIPLLRRIIALPRFHHWHHADEPQAMDRNFGGQLSFLDLLFGTWYYPEDDRLPKAYGTDEPVPDNYVDHLFYPFRRPRPGAEPEPTPLPQKQPTAAK